LALTIEYFSLLSFVSVKPRDSCSAYVTDVIADYFMILLHVRKGYYAV